MIASHREPPARDVLLRRAAAALAAAVALGIAALLLGTRVESTAGDGGERRFGPDPIAASAPRVAEVAGDVKSPAAAEGAASTPSVGSLAVEGASAGAGAAAPAESAAAPAATDALADAGSVPLAPPGVLLPEAAVAASAPGHRVQLGVFGDAANAVSVYERALAAGYEARIQSRVVVGPFADKAAAERAQRKLREAGLGAGVIVAPARSN